MPLTGDLMSVLATRSAAAHRFPDRQLGCFASTPQRFLPEVDRPTFENRPLQFRLVGNRLVV
jgi:hypothetical protein